MHYLNFVPYCMSPLKPFRCTTYQYFRHPNYFLFPSLQMYNLFPLLICSATACFCLTRKLPFASKSQFVINFIQTASTRPFLNASLRSVLPPKAHHSQVIPPLSHPQTTFPHKLSLLRLNATFSPFQVSYFIFGHPLSLL